MPDDYTIRLQRIKWLATHEKWHPDICVICRLGSACSVRAWWSETAFYDYIKFYTKVDLLKTEKYIKWKYFYAQADLKRHLTQMPECPFSRVASHYLHNKRYFFQRWELNIAARVNRWATKRNTLTFADRSSSLTFDLYCPKNRYSSPICIVVKNLVFAQGTRQVITI